MSTPNLSKPTHLTPLIMVQQIKWIGYYELAKLKYKSYWVVLLYTLKGISAYINKPFKKIIYDKMKKWLTFFFSIFHKKFLKINN